MESIEREPASLYKKPVSKNKPKLAGAAMSSERKHHEKDEFNGGDDEIENSPAKKPRKTTTPANDFLLLDLMAYDSQSDDDHSASTSTWTSPMVTTLGARFQLSLRPNEPPSTSRLLFKAFVPADILASYTCEFLRPSAQFHLMVTSSGDGALLLEARCAGAMNYYIMDHLLNAHHSPPTLTRLPDTPPCATFSCTRSMGMGMGLMRHGDHDHDDSYVVAGLEQSAKDWHVVFLSTSANTWRRKAVRVVPPELHDCYRWEITVVLTCGGRFWWVDLQRGLFSCSCDSLLLEEDDDGDQQRPVDLEFTLLPGVTMEQAKMAGLSKYHLESDRCVGVSDGRLRFVEVRAHRHCRSSSSTLEPPPLCEDCRGGTVTSWVLVDGHGGGGGGGVWVKEHTVKVADVWRDERYGSTGLPMEPPELPLVHPLDPEIVCFSIREGGYGNGGHEFCVHLGKKQVMSCSRYKDSNNLALVPGKFSYRFRLFAFVFMNESMCSDEFELFFFVQCRHGEFEKHL